MTIHVQSHDGTPFPASLAITLLTSDTYSIGGVSKTFAECYDPTYTPNDSATVAIVADEGLSVDFTGGGTATSASGTLIATAELGAVIDPGIGFTGVIDVTPVFSDPSEQVFLEAVLYTQNGPTGIAVLSVGVRSKAGGGMRIVIRDVTSGSPVFVDVVANVVSGQRYRLAFAFKSDLVMLSVNGSDAVSRIPSTTLDLSGRFLNLYAGIFNGIAGSSARIGDARYLPRVTSSNGLKWLSSQA